MKIAIANFGGLVPSRDPISLPENGAQTAKNVDLSGGTLRPWAITNAFTRLHDNLGDMVAGFDVTEIAKNTKASQVTLTKTIPMPNPVWKNVFVGSIYVPYGWLSTKAYIFFEYIDPDTDEFTTDSTSLWLLHDDVQYTPNGFILREYGAYAVNYAFKANVAYQVYGPLFQFYVIPYNDRRYAGGPDTTYTLPTTVYAGSDQVPSVAVPLLYPTTFTDYVDDTSPITAAYESVTAEDIATHQYGTLVCTDYDGAQRSYSRALTPAVTETFTFGHMSFTFDCNYVRNSAQRYYYVQQMVDSSGRDGPESDVSDEINVQPGKVPLLSTPLESGYTANRLFRSTNADDGFYKVEDVDATTFYDDLRHSLVEELPPNGNVPHATVGDAIKGAVKHPAGYAVYFYGTELRPSSEWIDMDRPWAVPEEYAYAFDSTIQCIALVGGTILVFTGTAVYTATGQHPSMLSVYKVSDKPILSKLSLWTTHDMVGWVNEEGVAVFSGGVVQLLTGEYYRAEQWSALTPATFAARVNDKAVCLFNSTGGMDDFRFDLRGPREAAISTFDVYAGESAYTWKSRIFQYPKPVCWFAARVVAAAYPVTLTLYADGVTVGDVSITNAEATVLPRSAPAYQWEVGVSAAGEVRSITVATSVQEA
jgi:hypothetical protein